MFEKAGGKLQTYYTLGEYDFVGIAEAPTDEDARKILLCLGSMGNVRTKTMRAWTEEEMAKSLSEAHSLMEQPTAPL